MMGNRAASRIRRIFLATLALVVALCGCEQKQDAGTTQEASFPVPIAQAEAFSTKDAPVFRGELTGETLTLRFYEDAPSVAYASVADFYKLMLPQGTMDVTAQDGGTYLLESHTGASESVAMEGGLGGVAYVDPSAGTITSPDLPAFTNVMSSIQEGMANAYLDGAPFVRVRAVEWDKPAEQVTIDLAKYGITIHADDGGVWLPVQTLGALFSNLHMSYVTYNGDKVYVNDESLLRPGSELDPTFYDAFRSSTERTADMVAFDYAQLCLSFDCFYGQPASSPEALRASGLDAFLQSTEAGQAVRAALLSPDPAHYLHGCEGLNRLLSADFHTSVNVARDVISGPDGEESELAKRYDELSEDETDPINQIPSARGDFSGYAIRFELADELYGEDTFVKQGSTAMINFDSFNNIDYEGWRAYLAGTGERPSADEVISDETLPSYEEVDSLAIFIEGLERAKADPEIKNVVVDLSNNGGGSADVLMYMAYAMCGCDTLRYQNVHTGQVVTEYFDVDANLDGTFDDADAHTDFGDLNFAVLTSVDAYSCGNLLPSVFKDADMLVMGEQSGGGSCAVEPQPMGNGLVFHVSSWQARLINKAGEEIDGGVPVDVNLLGEATSDGKDYGPFYDLDVIAQAMEEFYGEQELAEAA